MVIGDDVGMMMGRVVPEQSSAIARCHMVQHRRTQSLIRLEQEHIVKTGCCGSRFVRFGCVAAQCHCGAIKAFAWGARLVGI